MAARGRDLDRAPGLGLAPHVREVDRRRRKLRIGVPSIDGRGRFERRGPREVRDHAPERPGHEDLEPADGRGLRGVLGSDDEPAQPRLARRERGGERARHGARPAVEAQLGEEEPPLQPRGLHPRLGGDDRHRDGQIERRALLAHVGRREVDDNPLEGEVEARVLDGGADALVALARGRLGKADSARRGEPGGEIDLDADDPHVDAVERAAVDAGVHEDLLGSSRAPPGTEKSRKPSGPPALSGAR